jgi:hypothetical protein
MATGIFTCESSSLLKKFTPPGNIFPMIMPIIIQKITQRDRYFSKNGSFAALLASGIPDLLSK